MTYQIKSKLATLFQPCFGVVLNLPRPRKEGGKEGSLAERNLVADCVERGGDVCDNEGGNAHARHDSEILLRFP